MQKKTLTINSHISQALPRKNVSLLKKTTLGIHEQPQITTDAAVMNRNVSLLKQKQTKKQEKQNKKHRLAYMSNHTSEQRGFQTHHQERFFVEKIGLAHSNLEGQH